MAAKKLPPTGPIQAAAKLLGFEADSFLAAREHRDEDGELIRVAVVTAQGQKFSFTPAELADPKATRDAMKKRKQKIFHKLPHGPVRVEREEVEDEQP